MSATLERWQLRGLIAGGAGTAATLAGALGDPDQFFRSWLFAFLFWAAIAVGCLSITMINHLSGGLWGLVIRRILEAATRTLPLLALAFAPLLFGLPRIYEWAQPAAQSDPILRQKAPYLNVPFFAGRAVFYFVAWCLLAYFLNKWSLALDRGADRGLARRLRGLSGGGLLILGFTITFSSVDWAMSLSPHWFSTVYGILFMVGQALSSLAFAILVLSRLGGERPLKGVVEPMQVHDLGKLLLAFTMLWAYIHLSQFLIIWSGNLPEEIPWYLRRTAGGWRWLGLGLVVLHFAVPFLLLLSRELKRSARALAVVAGALLVMRACELFWLIGPDLHHGRFVVHWLDASALLGLGGLWFGAFAWQLKGRPLLPMGEPEIRERLHGVTA